jgi:TatD DNase family protein
MQLIDTHAHLDDQQFGNRHDEVVRCALEAGVVKIICVGTSAPSSARVIQLAERYPTIVAAVGIQPNCCAEAASDAWDRVIELASSPDVVALGETGLDRYWDDTPLTVQQDYFDRHLMLSQSRQLPLIIHMRDCEQEMLAMLREARQRGPIRGVMHSFTGSATTADECLELGLHISFAGMVTFPKSQKLRDVAAGIAADRILVETDSPYLSPQPVRGKRPNQPAWIVHTAACLAAVRGKSLEHFAAQTTANARRLFRLPAR